MKRRMFFNRTVLAGLTGAALAIITAIIGMTSISTATSILRRPLQRRRVHFGMRPNLTAAA